MQVTTARSYRCYHHRPGNPFAGLIPNEWRPFVQLKAANEEHARRAAEHVTGRTVSHVEQVSP